MKSLIVLMSLFLFSINAIADIGKSNKIDSILSLSGTSKINEDLEKMVDAQSRNLDSKIPSDARDAIARAYRDNFKAKELSNKMIDTLEKSFSSAEIEDIYSFYNNPEIKRVASLEEEASGVDKQRSKEDYLKTLQSNPPSKERVSIILNFFNKTRATDQSVDIVMAVQIPLAAATGKPFSGDDINAMRATLKPQMEQMNLVSALYTYKDLSNDELKRYYDKISGNSKVTKMGGIFITEIRNYCSQWALAIGKVLGEQKNELAKQKK